jgi:hypothetical protein
MAENFFGSLLAHHFLAYSAGIHKGVNCRLLLRDWISP